MTLGDVPSQSLVGNGKPAMRALIVDDHQMIRETLSRYLAEIGVVSVTEAKDFVSAFTAITKQPDFDLVLLDIRMPGVDGLTTLATLRQLFPKLRVVILSGSVDLADIRRAAENGAAGYLPKSMDHLPLVNALRLILSGEQYFPARIFQQADASLSPQAAGTVDLNTVGAVELTSRQKAVLAELAKGMSNREIGKTLGISEITVKIHVHSICQKLAARNRLQAVQRARSLGMLRD
ncbi:MAG: response regulator transcription factor [Rhodospirillales bacterium]|nr:response regulator transcription factor [Rhodospirillales bacterium]